MEENFYKHLIRPLLKREPGKEYFTYFREQGYRLWVLGFDSEDVKRINVLQKGYAELYAHNPVLFVNTVNQIYSKVHDVRTIVEASAGDYQDVSHEEGSIESFRKGFEYYKSLFESEFSLWISLFYAYTIECKAISQKVAGVDYVSVSAGHKKKILEGQKFSSLLGGIDHKLRNAGPGHESWELTDDGKCLYKDIDPKSGVTRESFEITTSELRDKIKRMERAAAVIDVSLHIFLANNPFIKIGYSALGIRPKISEIERMTSKMASEYRLEIRKFSFQKDRSALDLEIHHPQEPEILFASQVYTNLGGYEVVKIPRNVSFIEQALGLLFHIIHMNDGGVFDFQLKISDETKGTIYEGGFTGQELEKWIQLASKENKIYPVSREGGLLPDASYNLIVPISVEFGTGSDIQAIINNPLFTEKYKDYIVAINSV